LLVLTTVLQGIKVQTPSQMEYERQQREYRQQEQQRHEQQRQHQPMNENARRQQEESSHERAERPSPAPPIRALFHAGLRRDRGSGGRRPRLRLRSGADRDSPKASPLYVARSTIQRSGNLAKM
jgi:hypothetical protein